MKTPMPNFDWEAAGAVPVDVSEIVLYLRTADSLREWAFSIREDPDPNDAAKEAATIEVCERAAADLDWFVEQHFAIRPPEKPPPDRKEPH